MALPTFAPDELIASDLWNMLSELINGTAGAGQPVKLYDHNSASTYSLIVGNQDTTAGLIARFQYGLVASPTVVVDITKNGLAARIQDIGGTVFTLEAYAADGTTINDGTTDTDTAWSGAFAAVTAAGGGTVVLGPGTYLAPTSAVTWVDNCVIRGSGQGATVIKHRAASSRGPVYAVGRTNFHLRDLTVDGNRTNNNHPTTGFASDAEINLGGAADSSVMGVKVTNFNYGAMIVGGTRQVICNNWVDGPALSSYTANISDTQRDCGGLIGIWTPGTEIVRDLLVCHNRVEGLRANGIPVGGVGVQIIANNVKDCHRNDWAVATGGGQIATVLTKTTIANDQGPQNMVIADNVVSETTVGTFATGIEIDEATGVIVSNNVVYNQPAWGITVASGTDVVISGGSVAFCASATAGLGIGLRIDTGADNFAVLGVTFRGNKEAVGIFTGSNHFSFVGNVFTGNTTNWNVSGLGTNWTATGNVTITGDLVPESVNREVAATHAAVVANSSATGRGLQAWGASHALAAATTLTSAADRGVIAIQENGTDKVHLGLTATDLFGILNAAGTQSVFSVAPETGAVALTGAANGQSFNVLHLTENTTIAAAATTDTIIQMPANSVVLGVSVRVTTVIPTATTFTVGDSGSAARFSTAAVSVAAGSTDPGTKAGAYFNASALSVRITPNGTPGNNSGRVRVTIHYYTATPATS